MVYRLVSSSDTLRARAEKLRVTAATIADQDIKETLLRSAAGYERTAARRETPIKDLVHGTGPGHDQ